MKKKKYFELLSLKGLLCEKKFSYRKLAGEIGMSVDALNNKINGYSIFDTEEVHKIVNTLEIDPNDIVKYFFPSMLRNVTKNI